MTGTGTGDRNWDWDRYEDMNWDRKYAEMFRIPTHPHAN
jgi:hypothetical protein